MARKEGTIGIDNFLTDTAPRAIGRPPQPPNTDTILPSHARIALLVPCYNEALTIATIIRDFRTSLPTAKIYVFDNNPTDGTAQIARDAGAIVRSVPTQGKGSVVRRMLAGIEAGAYVMVDGDGTCDASVAPQRVRKLLAEGFDMLVGNRVTQEQAAYRFSHRFGNGMLTGFVSLIFGRTFKDILARYRVFLRR